MWQRKKRNRWLIIYGQEHSQGGKKTAEKISLCQERRREQWALREINKLGNWAIYKKGLYQQYKHTYIYRVEPPARISLTLSNHSFILFIASGRSSGLHPVSSRSCCMYVRAGRPAFARPYERVHKSTSLMSSSLLLQQCPGCLVRLNLIVFVMGGMWPYSWCFVGCYLQDFGQIEKQQ